MFISYSSGDDGQQSGKRARMDLAANGTVDANTVQTTNGTTVDMSSAGMMHSMSGTGYDQGYGYGQTWPGYAVNV